MSSRRYRELSEIIDIANGLGAQGRVRTEGTLKHRGLDFPVMSFSFGSKDCSKPALVLIGGVHGLERVGTHILITFLRSLIKRLDWDASLKENLEHCRLLVYPLVNPIGMFLGRRSNGNGIDLMRNAPIQSANATFLVGGQRISRRLPWFRGYEGIGMEMENLLLSQFIEREVFPSRISVALDIHSGFGVKDRLWFPFAHTRELFPDADKVMRLKDLLDGAYPHHIYQIEPQCHSYLTHGDIWDYLYQCHGNAAAGNGTFLPLTLEIGSWNWVKKNPRQLFSSVGPFNPMVQHREERVMRRHNTLFDFLYRVLYAHEQVFDCEKLESESIKERTRTLWALSS